MTCKCCDEKTTTAELKERHGTPEEFERAVLNALGEISIDEAKAAIVAYKRDWVAAAIRENTSHFIGG